MLALAARLACFLLISALTGIFLNDSLKGKKSLWNKAEKNGHNESGGFGAAANILSQPSYHWHDSTRLVGSIRARGAHTPVYGGLFFIFKAETERTCY